MRKSCLLTLSAIVLSSGMFAQTLLKNDGAMLVVEPGATLVIEGGVENVNGGTINNDGTMEIQGSFLNSVNSFWDSVGTNTVIFSGTAAANVTSNGAVFQNVQMNKTAQNITLQDNMIVKGTLTFQADNNKIILGANNLTIRDPGSIASADENEYVVTNGAGYLRKEGLGASETFTFPVGFNSTTYNPATLTGNAVGHTSDVFSVRALQNVQEDGLSGDVFTEGVADVSWEINEGTPGGSNVNLTLQWEEDEELTEFDRTMSAISKHNGTGWNMLFSDLGGAAGADPYTRSKDITVFTAPSVFAVGSEKELARALEGDLIAYLEGVYVSGTNMQNDALRAGGIVPTSEPYSGLGYAFEGFGGGETTTLGAMNQPADGDDAVDWIVVELRDAGDNTSVVASRAAILQRDGDIVSEDGASMLQIYGVPEASYYVAVRFRNHLGVMTANPVSFASMGVFDFTTAAAGQIHGTNGFKTAPDGKKVLIMGNVNSNLPDNSVNSADLTALAPSAAVGLTNIYTLLDVNMDRFVNSADLSTLQPNAAVGYSQQIPN